MNGFRRRGRSVVAEELWRSSEVIKGALDLLDKSRRFC